MISDSFYIKDIFNARGKDILKLCGISRQGLDFLNKKTDLPRKENSRYDLTITIPWILEYKAEQLNRENVKLKDDDPKRIQEVIKLKNQNKKLELEIARLQKEVIPIEEVTSIFQNNISELLQFLTLGFKKNGPEMLSRLGIGGDHLDHFFSIMDDYVKQAMSVFSKGGQDWIPHNKDDEEEEE